MLNLTSHNFWHFIIATLVISFANGSTLPPSNNANFTGLHISERSILEDFLGLGRRVGIPMYVGITIFAVLLGTFFINGKSYFVTHRKLPPGPTKWPIVGCLPTLSALSPVPNRAFGSLADKFGPVVSVWMGSSLHIIISSAEAAREVLKDFDSACSSRPLPATISILTNGGTNLVFAPSGDHFKHVRKICNTNLFTRSRINSFHKIRMEELDHLHNAMQEACKETGGLVSVRRHLFLNSLSIIMRVAIGRRFEKSTPQNPNPEGDEFFELVKFGLGIAGSMNASDYIPILRPFDPQGLTAGAKKFVEASHKFFMNEINKHKQELSQRTETSEDKEQHKPSETAIDFTSALLSLENLSDIKILGLLQDMLFAGSETSSVTVEWALLELLRHPEKLRKLQEELEDAFGAPKLETSFATDEAWEAQLTKLPYLNAVMKETLRLHSPVPLLIPHKTTQNVLLNGGKFAIPAGTTVIVNAWYISRSSTTWKDPLEFQPERFLEKDVDARGTDFSLLPFGAGRRMCPGFAMGELAVLNSLAMLVHCFEWSKGPGDLSVEESYQLSLAPKQPLEAFVKPRTAAQNQK